MIHRYDAYDTYMWYIHAYNASWSISAVYPSKICTSRNVFFFRNPLDEIYLPRGFPRLEKVKFWWVFKFLVRKKKSFWRSILDNLGVFQLFTPQNLHLQKRFCFFSRILSMRSIFLEGSQYLKMSINELNGFKVIGKIEQSQKSLFLKSKSSTNVQYTNHPN